MYILIAGERQLYTKLEKNATVSIGELINFINVQLTRFNLEEYFDTSTS